MPFDYRVITLLALFLVILARMSANFTLRRYWPLALFVACGIASLLARTFAEWAWGTSAGSYLTVAYITEAAYFAGAIALVLWIASLPSGMTRRLVALAALCAVGVVAFEAWTSPGAHPYLRMSRAFVQIRAVIALIAIFHVFGNSCFSIGRNLGAALVCEFATSAAHSFAELMHMARIWDYRAWDDFAAFVHLIGWGIVAWANWDLDTPSKRE